MGSFDFRAAMKSGVVFYSDPQHLDPSLIDERIRDTVVRINQSGWLWTAESCQGHPDDTTGMAWAGNTSPMLRMACHVEDVGRLFQALYEASTSMVDRDGLPESYGWKVHPERRNDGWAEVLLYVGAVTVYGRDRALEMLSVFAELVQR